MFANDFDFAGVRRFYVLNFATSTVRAFTAIRTERLPRRRAGSAIVAAVRINDTAHPDRAEHVERFVLSVCKPAVLQIPAGYANGFRALEDGTRIIVFSSASLEEAAGDDYRFPADYWGADVWSVEDR